MGVVVHDVQRMAVIANVLRKFGFGNLVRAIRYSLASDFDSSREILETMREQSDDLAVNLRAAIEELGTTYIKLGQMLSTRYDLLPMNIIRELEKLQDSSPHIPFDTVEAILNEAYGDYHDYFESIVEEPIGAASIAQAHRAVLKDGTHVVIKVQRPNLLPLIRSDIDILYMGARALDRTIEEISYFNLPSLIREFEQSVVSELNFHHEQANIEYFEQKYSHHDMVVFPTPSKELTRDNILVMKEIEGKKITTIEPDTPEAHKMSDAILDMAFDMVFREGVFHADPHPGNVFATPDNRIGLLDFGLVGRFSERQRSVFTRIVLAVHVGDCAVIARSLLSLGHPTKRVILSDLENEIACILQKYKLSSLQDVDLASFATDFVSAGQKFAVQIPSEFTDAIRALINIEGIIQYLNPHLDIYETLSLFSGKLMSDCMNQKDLKNQLLQAGLNALEFGHSVPSQVTQIMQDLEHDGIAIRQSSEYTKPLEDAINGLATRLSMSLMIIGIVIVLVLFNPEKTVWIDVGLIVSCVWIVVLFVWHYRSRAIRRKIRINPMLSRMKRRKKWF